MVSQTPFPSRFSFYVLGQEFHWVDASKRQLPSSCLSLHPIELHVLFIFISPEATWSGMPWVGNKAWKEMQRTGDIYSKLFLSSAKVTEPNPSVVHKQLWLLWCVSLVWNGIWRMYVRQVLFIEPRMGHPTSQIVSDRSDFNQCIQFALGISQREG